VNWLIGLTEDRSRLAEESRISRHVFHDYRQAQLQAFQDLWSEIRSEFDLRRACETGMARASIE
jgi:hypothetical protein